MDYGFYGGRRGQGFVLAGKFNSIQAMVTEFKKGGAYTAINYDEYVIIDTVNKNDADNGKIYQRGYDYKNSMGGAVYKGQIVGPSGNAPIMQMDLYDNVKNKTAQSGYTNNKATGSYTVTNASLVPGKQNGVYNDSIEWAVCSVRDNNGLNTTAYVGFKFPYPVLEFNAESVSAYTTGELATRTDNGSHPFFEEWHIKVPKGVKGDAFKNLRVLTITQSNKNTVQDYAGKDDDAQNSRKIIVYDYYDYTSSATPTAKTFYVGDYNSIENVTVGDDGTLTIDYTHDNNDVFSKKIKWISSVSLTDTGVFTVNYNNGAAAYTKTIDWINSLAIADNGTVTIGHSSANDEVLTNKIKWVTGATLSDAGAFSMTFNNGSPLTKTIKWISSVTRDNTTGDLKITYNNSSTPVSVGKIKDIVETRINSSNYHLEVKYRGDSSYTDLGATRTDNGILIGKNYDVSSYPQMSTQTGAINKLNADWPNGLTGSGLTGKIVSVGGSSSDKSLYAFDYTIKAGGGYNGWFFLGLIGNSQLSVYVGAESQTNSAAAALPTGGIWFIEE